MKNHNSLQFITVVILLSIATVFCEFLSLYFFEDDKLAVYLSIILLLIVSNVMLSITYNYESIFIYTLLNILFSVILAAYSFWELQYFYYSVDNYELWIVILNFVIPCITSLIRNLFDTSRNFNNYRNYYRSCSVLFFFFYFATYIYVEFIPSQASLCKMNLQNYIPFYTIAGYIEDFIYRIGTLQDIFQHMILPIGLFVPFGFLISNYIRHQCKIIHFLVALLFPLITEVIQVVSIHAWNIDDVLYGFLGCILGQLVFQLINRIYLAIQGQEFLSESPTYHSSLHF